MFESSRLKGLLNQLLAVPPIPFESGVDFWLNCPVCLVKVTVFNPCHLIASVTPNSVAEGCQLSTLLVWWPIAGLRKSRKRLQRGFNPAPQAPQKAWGLAGVGFAVPPIPFESGVDFWLNCPVCLVKLTVFNLCHLVPRVTPNSVTEGCQLSTLLVWWPIAAF